MVASPPARRPVAVVTGANTGIGLQTARRLASLGYTVVVASRDAAKGQAAAAAIGPHAEYQRLDLSSLASVAAFCDDVARRHPRLHALVLNAGMNTIGTTLEERRNATDTGDEQCFQVNFTAQFYLTLKLLPLLKAAHAARASYPGATPVRVVTLCSVTHWVAPAAITDWDRVIAGADEVGASAYSLSKLAAALFAYELQRRLSREGLGGGIQCITVNPGAVDSDIWRTFSPGARCVCRPLMRTAFLTTEQGCETSVVAATAGAAGGVPLQGGEYLVPYYTVQGGPAWLAALTETLGPFAGARMTRSSARTYDEPTAVALWDACQRAIAAWEGGAAARGRR